MTQMTKKGFSKTCLLLATILLALTGITPGLQAQVARRPNIIFIMADDLGYGSLGCYGQTKIKTPNIDRLAASGLKFTQYYADPICSPSRCGLLTGKDMAHAYIRDNYEIGGFDFTDAGERGQMPLPDNTVTFPGLLRQGGYTTALIGKWGLGGPNTSGVPTRQGFNYFFGYLGQRQAHNYYPTHLWRNDQKVMLGNTYFSPHQSFAKGADPNDIKNYARYSGRVYSCDTMAADVLRFIREHTSRPFFLEFSPTIPHVALQVTQKALERYEGQFDDQPMPNTGYLPSFRPRQTYAAMISLLDDYVGQIVATLKEQGLLDNTLIIFTSDNGAPDGEGGTPARYFEANGPWRGYKGDVFEGGIRVPLIACWPGVIQAGSQTDHPTTIWDMFATFCDLSGTKIPENSFAGRVETQGISIAPLLTGKGQQSTHAYLYWELASRHNGEQAVRLGDWKGIRLNAKEDPSGPVLLYNLKTDPAEKIDQAAAHPDIVQKIEQLMKKRTLSHLNEWNFEYKTPG
ncbi:arylsulfatase [Arachidicoccus rhizosphaerae]|nr:arylsulfatase [Arachidicoccus rhizosphaerae]